MNKEQNKNSNAYIYNKYMQLKKLSLKNNRSLREAYSFLMNNPNFFKNNKEYTIGLSTLYKRIVLMYNLEIVKPEIIENTSRFTRTEMLKALVNKIIRVTLAEDDMRFYVKNFKYLMQYLNYRTYYFYNFNNCNTIFIKDLVKCIYFCYEKDKQKLFDIIFGLYYSMQETPIELYESFISQVEPKEKRKLIISPVYKFFYIIKHLNWFLFKQPDFLDLE